MKPILWVVIPCADNIFKSAHTTFGYSSYHLENMLKDQIEIFPDPDNANGYARDMSSLNGGRSYIVCSTEAVYFASPSKTTKKIWKGGELVPE